MAINLIPENSNSTSSPRISFSHDLPVTNSSQAQEEVDIARLDMSLSTDQNSEFNFCASTCLPENESCPADELFFNGVIIPTQMKHKLDSFVSFENKENEEVTSSTTATLVRQEKNTSKSFWRFRRSSSLNYENYGHKKSSSLWSMPLFRSKSTGSSSSSSSNYNPKQIQKSCSSNNGKLTNNQSARFSAAACQKPPLKTGGSGSGGSTANSLRNVAALNVPPPYITKGTSDLLGFSALFRNVSKEKKNKK